MAEKFCLVNLAMHAIGTCQAVVAFARTVLARFRHARMDPLNAIRKSRTPGGFSCTRSTICAANSFLEPETVMYVSAAFRADDARVLHALVHAHPHWDRSCKTNPNPNPNR
ncbi:glutamine synthetase [Burkholderiales bacterium GJ-E10]|nr:glutamine synthetase [Burkholderiales bacterium GJ-E10]